MSRRNPYPTAAEVARRYKFSAGCTKALLYDWIRARTTEPGEEVLVKARDVAPQIGRSAIGVKVSGRELEDLGLLTRRYASCAGSYYRLTEDADRV